MKRQFLNLLFALLAFNSVDAQCNVVSGESGTIHDSDEQVFVDYTVEVFGGATYYLIAPFSACDIPYPEIYTAFTGNIAEAGTIEYTFSQPIHAVRVILAGVGFNGQILQESFTFTTNNENPVISVDPGSCAEWIIEDNVATSPEVLDGLNGIALVYSKTPFTTLTILGSEGGNIDGGSFVGFCDSSLIPASVVSVNENGLGGTLTIYPNPTSGSINFQLPNEALVSIFDMNGRLVQKERVVANSLTTMHLPAAKGLYTIQAIDDSGNILSARIVKD
jgi:hypothetical protein